MAKVGVVPSPGRSSGVNLSSRSGQIGERFSLQVHGDVFGTEVNISRTLDPTGRPCDLNTRSGASAPKTGQKQQVSQFAEDTAGSLSLFCLTTLGCQQQARAGRHVVTS